MQVLEQVYAEVLRTLYKNNMISHDLLHRKINELQIMLFKREREEGKF